MRLSQLILAIGVLPMLMSGCKPPPPQAKVAPAPPQPVQMEQVKAGVGVGLKGRSLDEYEGPVVTPVKAFFAAKEKIVFEIQFPSQYQIYRVTNDPPKDFDDLKEKVLDPFQIKLPVLPPGHKYVWNAETEELMVERPAKASAGGTPPQK